ncbi:MAG: permease prefix domain 1-containing protein [Planctomycetota bacterium]
MSEREFEAYLNLLARTLKLSEAQRQRIAGELRDHLEERLADLVDDGMDRGQAILAALDEFGDAHVLAHDLTTPQSYRRRKKIIHTSFATIAAAAAVALAATYLLPTNHRGHPPQPAALAESAPAEAAAEEARAADTGTESAAGFVYIMGETQRPGAYSVPGKNKLTLLQLIASAGGLVEDQAKDDLRLRVVRRQGEKSELVTTFTYREVMDGGEPFYLEPDDLIRIIADPGRVAEKAPTMVTFDLLPLFELALDDDNLEADAGSPGLAKLQERLAGNLFDVLVGMGHERDVKTVTAWLGVLTVVGSPAAITDAQNYLDQTQQTLAKRATRTASEPQPQE